MSSWQGGGDFSAGDPITGHLSGRSVGTPANKPSNSTTTAVLSNQLATDMWRKSFCRFVPAASLFAASLPLDNCDFFLSFLWLTTVLKICR